MQKLKTVLVGCGSVSQKHIAALRANRDNYNLVGVVDIDTNRARLLANQTKVQAYADMDRMGNDLRPDVAVISTPSALHAQHAVYWMERGAHLVLEKPVALSTTDIQRISSTATSANRKVVVGYVLRYAPHIRLLARAFEEGRFGRILHVGLTIYWNRDDTYYTSAPWRGTWEHDGGTLMNQATHGIDLMQWLLGGDPVSVQGRLARLLKPIEADDFASGTIAFGGGGIGTVTVTVDTYRANHGTRLTILGQTGTVELAGKGPDRIVTWDFLETPGWSEIDAAVHDGTWSSESERLTGHAGVYEDLADAIRHDREPVANFESSRISAEIVLGIQKSHCTGAIEEFPISFSTKQMTGVSLIDRNGDAVR